MPPVPTSQPKICVHCGDDCSGKPRLKDKQGRYHCEPCVRKAKATAPRAHAPPAPAPAQADDILPLADDGLPLLEESARPPAATSPCPGCGRPLAPDAVLCVNCGHNRATGTRVATGGAPPARTPVAPGGVVVMGKGSTCGKCGYSLKGLGANRCPECGTTNRKPDKRDIYAAESRRIARMAYLKPTLMIGIGLAISTGMLVARGGGFLDVVASLISLAISLTVATVVYFVCSAVWIGFDEPFPVMVLRLAGVFAVFGAIFSVIGTIMVLSVFGWVGLIFIFMMLFAATMEIDLEDAVIAGLIIGLCNIATRIALMALLSDAF